MNAVIETHGLAKHFGRVHALDGLDLTVGAGEVHGFLGPNGAGKSTTIRILLGLARATSGEARVFGRDPWREASGLHRRIATIPGDVALWPNLSGGETIDLLVRLRGGDTKAAAYQQARAALIDEFQFDPSKKARSYSKGNRQKVALIAAFAHPAELYVLDEPTSGLDPLMESVFTRQVGRVAAEGGTVLLSSHILSEVEKLCTRISIVRAGRVVESGSLTELRHLTRTSFSFERTGPTGTELTDAQLAALPGAHDLALNEGRVSLRSTPMRWPGCCPPSARSGCRGCRSRRPRSRSCSCATTATSSSPRRREVFGLLLRFRLRRDRTQLIVWGVVHFLVAYLVVGAVNTTYGTVAERAATIKVLMITPVILLFRGTPQGTSAGDFMALLGLTFMAVLVALQSTFLVVRHTRAEEAAGQTETIAATAAGRLSPSLAVVALGVIANVIATVVLAAGCLAGGLPAAGSWLFGAALGMVGLTFVGVAFLLAQLFPASRSANGWAATLVMVAYVVRGLGDATGTPHLDTLTLTPTGLIWASPIGWAQRTLPWSGHSRAWPLLLGVASFVVLTAVALVIQDRRDVGAGILAERRGRLSASAWLGGPVGLALRLQRGVLIGWVLAVVGGALLLGGLSGVMVDQLQTAGTGVTNALDEIGGGGTMLQAFVNVGAIFSGLLASAICVQGAMRLRQEEGVGGTDAVLSTATGRVRWMLSFLVVAAVGAVVSLVLGGLIAGAVAGHAGGGFATWFWAIVWETPAVLVFLGLVALVFAVWPQGTIGVGWALFALGAILGMFGPLFGLPEWARKLAPFAHTPAVALPDPNFTGGWVMALVAVVLVVASVALFRLRDTKPGA